MRGVAERGRTSRSALPRQFVGTAVGPVVATGADLREADVAVGGRPRHALDERSVEDAGIGGRTLDATVGRADLAEPVSTGVAAVVATVGPVECGERFGNAGRVRGDHLATPPSARDERVGPDGFGDYCGRIEYGRQRVPLFGLDRRDTTVGQCRLGSLPVGCRRTFDTLEKPLDRPPVDARLDRRPGMVG